VPFFAACEAPPRPESAANLTLPRDARGLQNSVIEREGPTGSIVTTTQTGLDPELETRLLSLTVTDMAAQSKAVMQALARSRSSSGAVPVDYARWHDFQQWLSAGERDYARLRTPATRLTRSNGPSSSE
jgi:hypothetical protein